MHYCPCSVVGWDCGFWHQTSGSRGGVDLIESAIPCHNVHVLGLYPGLITRLLTVLVAKSEDYAVEPKHLRLLYITVNALQDTDALFDLRS